MIAEEEAARSRKQMLEKLEEQKQEASKSIVNSTLNSTLINRSGMIVRDD